MFKIKIPRIISLSLQTKPFSTTNLESESFINLCTKRNLKQAISQHSPLIPTNPHLISHFLKPCVETRNHFLLQQLHALTITSGRSNQKFVSNHLITSYSKLGHLKTALQVFEKMPDRNIMSYNIVIGGYIQNGELGFAVDVFNEMGRRNSGSWNAVITGLIKSEFNEEGLSLFEEMHKTEFLSLPDSYTLGSVLRGCAGLKDLGRGRQVHCYAVKLGLDFDLVVGSALAHMYMRGGGLGEGERVVESMPLCNVIAFNTLIAGKVQNGFPMAALDAYYLMKRSGFRPDKITFSSLIRSCSELSTLGQGIQIHAEVVKCGGLSAAAVISSLISMYSRCGCLDEAVRVFEERDEAEDDHVLLSSMIAAYGLYGKGEEAIEVFRKMELQGLVANDVTFLSLLYSCSHSGLKDKGLEYFNLMTEKYKLEPKVKHYSCVVDLLGRAGRLEEGEAFIRSMPIKPDVITWKALLSACKIHKNADMAKRIAEEILKINPNDSASYVLLSNAQASAKQWPEVSYVRRTMRDKMIKKKPGVSWFELKNKIHHFIVGDKSPQSEEIDLYLKELMSELKSIGYVPDIGSVLHDMDTEEKEYNLAHHSEKLAVAFALMNTPDGVTIRIMKNLRMCGDCHVAMKYISVVKNREIVVRDSSRFHHFKNGHCSCGDYW